MGAADEPEAALLGQAVNASSLTTRSAAWTYEARLPLTSKRRTQLPLTMLGA